MKNEGTPKKEKISKIVEEKRLSRIVDLMMEITFFDGLMDEDLTIVAKHISLVEKKKGEILFREGDKGDYVCFVIDGGLEVIKEAVGPRKSAIISRISKNRSIGEMSVIDNTPRSATVRTSTKTSLVILSKKSFDSILKDHPRIGIEILKRIARLMSLNLRKTSSRLADYLLPIA